MVATTSIERHEVAPVTDEDWDTALRYYAADRPSRGDASHPKLMQCGCPPTAYTDNCDRLGLKRSASDFSSKSQRPDLSATHPYAQPLLSHSPSPSNSATSSPENANPLIHEEASLEDDLSTFGNLNLDQTSANPSNEWRRHQFREFATQPSNKPHPAHAIPDLSLQRCRSQPGQERRSSIELSPPAAVTMSKSPSTTTLRQALTLEEKDEAMRRAAHPSRRQELHHIQRLSSLLHTPEPVLNYPFPVPELDGLPRPINVDEDPGHLCMGAERQRLRRVYEDEGWLPAPNPSQTTRFKRATAIRRLGLNESDDEQYAVMAKYAETAAMIFQAKYGFVCLLRGDIEEVYLPNYKQHKITFPLSSSLIGHAVLTPSEKCFVVSDLDKDWRFGKHPDRIGERKTRFMAAAPLRFFHSNGDYADFGSLVVFDPEPRDTFDEREQNILLRLANMCVYQLATLQSELMAKRSSGMYEASINFLRRSLVPDIKNRAPPERNAAEARRPKRKPPEKRSASQTHNRRYSNPVTAPVVTQRPSLSGRASPREVTTGEPLETKVGPKDAQKIRKKDSDVEETMFMDACDTLRDILGANSACMVDLRDYQLFIRKATKPSHPSAPPSPSSASTSSKENIIQDFLSGKEWPSEIEPVVNQIKRNYDVDDVNVLGSSSDGSVGSFRFDGPEASKTLTKYIKAFLQNRRFWWDREDTTDDLSLRVLGLMPSTTQTVLANVFMTWNGSLKFVTFITWDKPPSSFDDTSRLAMPFVYIVGAALVSSMAIFKMRGIEESQISYSNLQAHELRTPLHQILAITQLLRSSMSDMAKSDEAASSHSPTLSTLQQVRDLLPFLDAIDTSGKILHGIVDNILTFLDLTDKDQGSELGGLTAGARSTQQQTLGQVMEELIREAYEEDRLTRASLEGGPVVTKSTIFEIIPRGLGEQVVEDDGGALRRAIGRILHNAYRYLDDQGCVEIYLDNVLSMLPPEGCEDLQPSVKRISLKIIDNGRGMSRDFVKEKLGEPWSKEDPYATGSGLSVHLAYRIIDLMGGHMEISSAPGKGCSVSMEVPVPTIWSLPADAAPQAPEEAVLRRHVHVLGFTRFHDPHCSLKRIGAMLERTYAKMGHAVVPLAEADLVIVEGSLALSAEGMAALRGLTRPDLVLFVGEDPEAFSGVVETLSAASASRSIRLLQEPIVPSVIEESLRPVEGPAAEARAGAEPQALSNYWRPRGNVAESIAALCLGDYFSSRRSARAPALTRTDTHTSSSVAASLSPPSSLSTGTTPPSSVSSMDPPAPALAALVVPEYSPLEEEEEPALPLAMDVVRVLIIEDNVINRKILVKILRQHCGADCELVEAENGLVGLEKFKELAAQSPVIVLLDINMPVLDGYQTAAEMRAWERELAEKKARRRARRSASRSRLSLSMSPTLSPQKTPQRSPMGSPDMEGSPGSGSLTSKASVDDGRSKIFAVTALAGENEKRRGLLECGFDGWLTKPCDKITLQKVVDRARMEIQGLV